MSNTKDKEWAREHLSEICNCINSFGFFDSLDMAKKAILSVRKSGGKVIFAGNGTSSLTATRGAMGLLTQLGIRCASVNDHAFITAAANDFGYDDIFTRYVNLFADKGDVVILISASGGSKNVLNASLKAKENGCIVITFSGFNFGNPLNKSGDINFWAPSNDYSKIESVHNVWIATICDFILKDESDKVGIHGIEFK
jgi:D-sedoheptulose 7-phosphate isomerase